MSPQSPRPATAVGVLDGVASVQIDAAGSLRTAEVELQWWIGAEDRWHRPEREVAVRRQLLDGAPVVQTLLRIPGGDARVNGYGAVVAGREWTVLEVHNDSRTPVAVALVARSATTGADRSWRPDGARLWCDGSVLLVANRPADGFGAAAGPEELATLLGEGAGDGPVAADHPTTAGSVAMVFAVAHGTGIRVLVAPGALPVEDRVEVSPLDAPTAEGVIRGWHRQLDARCRYRLGDEQAELDAFERRCRLLLSRDATAPADISALAAFGHGPEAARRLDVALSELHPPVEADRAAALLVAASDVVAWAADDTEAAQLAGLLAGPVLELAGWARQGPRRWGRRRDPVGPSSLLADWAAQRLLARHAEAVAEPGGSLPDAATAQAVAEHRATTMAADDDAAALLALRFGLVDDDGAGGPDLLAGWQPGWRGRALEVHGLPTAFGSLAFALRWHGARPALLWELTGAVPSPTTATGGPTVRAARLDPDFAGDLRRGEALLAEPSPDPAVAADATGAAG